uniref:EF-hand domain-containing protein n=1 Tax=Macrostomum lignano TaxID=282301 RepID=A0A1I8J263_9PLAT
RYARLMRQGSGSLLHHILHHFLRLRSAGHFGVRHPGGRLSKLSTGGIHLFRIILGDVNFYKIQQANRLIGPVYFLLYVFFKFGEVKADNEFGGGHARIDVARFLRRRADRLMDKLAVRRQKVLDIQRAVLQCGDEATVNFEGWRNQLRQRGFADAEIEALFAKYDADGDQVLSAAERMQMRRDLEGEKMKLDREITGAAPAPDQVETSFEVGSDAACSVLDEDAGAPGLRSGFRGEPASRDELAFLTRRVDRLEGRVGGALNSIDR